MLNKRRCILSFFNICIKSEQCSFSSVLSTRTGYLEEGDDISNGGLSGDDGGDTGDSTHTFLAGGLTNQLVDLKCNKFKSCQRIKFIRRRPKNVIQLVILTLTVLTCTGAVPIMANLKVNFLAPIRQEFRKQLCLCVCPYIRVSVTFTNSLLNLNSILTQS